MIILYRIVARKVRQFKNLYPTKTQTIKIFIVIG